MDVSLEHYEQPKRFALKLKVERKEVLGVLREIISFSPEIEKGDWL